MADQVCEGSYFSTLQYVYSVSTNSI